MILFTMGFVSGNYKRYLNIKHGRSSRRPLSKYLFNTFLYCKARVTFVNEDGISQVILERQKGNASWGFRLSGGKDEGIALKLAKVKIGEKNTAKPYYSRLSITAPHGKWG